MTSLILAGSCSSRLCFFNRGGVITACLKFAVTDPDSSDMSMIVANVGTRISMLAFTSEVGSGSSTLDFVGHFLT